MNFVLPSHVILKVKRDENGAATRFKARVVVGGHKQQRDIDFDDIYAPVVEFSSIRLFLIVAFKNNWKWEHVDVTAAFLNGDIDRD